MDAAEKHTAKKPEANSIGVSTGDLIASLSSLRPDPKLLDERTPLLGVRLHARAERLRRLLVTRKNLHSEVGETGLHRRIGQCLHHCRIERADDVPGRAFVREKPGLGYPLRVSPSPGAGCRLDAAPPVMRSEKVPRAAPGAAMAARCRRNWRSTAENGCFAAVTAQAHKSAGPPAIRATPRRRGRAGNPAGTA